MANWSSFKFNDMSLEGMDLTKLQIAYGAVILSFLGGPHWGFAFSSPAGFSYGLRFLWGVTPSLIAWPALMMPQAPAIDLLSAGLGLTLTVDTTFALVGLLPVQYLMLRIPLTCVAIASLQSNNEDSKLLAEIKSLTDSLSK